MRAGYTGRWAGSALRAGGASRSLFRIADKDGKNLEVDFVYYSSRAELPIFAEAAQADAAKIGIKVNLKNVDYNVMDKLGVSGDYDLMISNIMTEQAGDPLNFLNMYWRSNID
ncbi:MAG: hypothetical protein IIY32_03160, partial [Thermoguttaceae bacterium]|nr:hypothetical protein [Thermoguttaceae bacterium]